MEGPPLLPRQARDIPEIRALCERLVPGEIPDIVPMEAAPWAEPDECLANVAGMVERFGGETVVGWRLLESLPDLMIETEFHAVWRKPDGSLLDVSIPVPGFKETVFLPDPKLEYEGRQIPNQRVPLKEDTLIEELIEAFDAHFEVMNRGELADYHGLVNLTPEMQAVEGRIQTLLAQIVQTHY